MRFRLILCTSLASATLLAGCGSSPSPSAFAQLSGKYLPGAPKSWIKVQKIDVKPVTLEGSQGNPVGSINSKAYSGEDVMFFDFPTTAKASSFESHLPIGANLYNNLTRLYEPVSGSTGLSVPSHWYDMRSCFSNPGSGIGSATFAKLLPDGHCASGTLGSAGFAIALRQGKVVGVVEAIGGGTNFGSAGVQAAIDQDICTKAKSMASEALSLLREVHVPAG
jgi:hypothetical protein